MAEKMTLTDAEWRERLTPEQYAILRQKGTERAFTGQYEKNKAAGEYVCAACGQPLFESDAKFDSGTGWPSFSAPADQRVVETRQDHRLMMERTEVHCSQCAAHLGHVFPDGPGPEGLRYCVNSASLSFDAKKPG